MCDVSSTVFAHVWALAFKTAPRCCFQCLSRVGKVPQHGRAPGWQPFRVALRQPMADDPPWCQVSDRGWPQHWGCSWDSVGKAFGSRFYPLLVPFQPFAWSAPWPYNLLRLVDWTSAGSCQGAQSDWALLPLQRKVPKMKSMSHVHPTSGWRWPLWPGYTLSLPRPTVLGIYSTFWDEWLIQWL